MSRNWVFMAMVLTSLFSLARFGVCQAEQGDLSPLTTTPRLFVGTIGKYPVHMELTEHVGPAEPVVFNGKNYGDTHSRSITGKYWYDKHPESPLFLRGSEEQIGERVCLDEFTQDPSGRDVGEIPSNATFKGEDQDISKLYGVWKSADGKKSYEYKLVRSTQDPQALSGDYVSDSFEGTLVVVATKDLLEFEFKWLGPKAWGTMYETGTAPIKDSKAHLNAGKHDGDDIIFDFDFSVPGQCKVASNFSDGASFSGIYFSESSKAGIALMAKKRAQEDANWNAYEDEKREDERSRPECEKLTVKQKRAEILKTRADTVFINYQRMKGEDPRCVVRTGYVDREDGTVVSVCGSSVEFQRNGSVVGTWTDIGVIHIEDPQLSNDGHFLLFHEGEEYFVLNDQGKVLARKRLPFQVRYPKWIEDSKGRQLIFCHTEDYRIKAIKTDLDIAWDAGEAANGISWSPNSRLMGYTTLGKAGELVIRRADGSEVGRIAKESLSLGFTGWELFNSGTLVAFDRTPTPRLFIWKPGRASKLLVVLPEIKFREAEILGQKGEGDSEMLDVYYRATSDEVKDYPHPTIRIDVRALKASWTENAPKDLPQLHWYPKVGR